VGTNLTNTASVWVWEIPVAELESGTIPNGPSNYWFSSIDAFVPLPAPSATLLGVAAAGRDLLLKIGATSVDNSLILYTTPPASCDTFQSCTGNYTAIQGNKNDPSLVYAPLMPKTGASTTAKSTTQASSSPSGSVTTAGSLSSSSATTQSGKSTSSAASSSPSSSASSAGKSALAATYALGEVAAASILAVAFVLTGRRRVAGPPA